MSATVPAAETIPTVDQDEFDAVLASEARPVLADFTASWCGPCAELAPRLEQFAAAEGGRVRVVAVDVDASPELSARYDVVAMPTLILFAGGVPVLRLSGPEDLATVAAGLDALDAMDALGALEEESSLSAPGRLGRGPRAARLLRFKGRGPGVIITPEQSAGQSAGQGGQVDTVIDVPAGHTTFGMVSDADELGSLTGLDPDALDSLVVHSETPLDLAPVLRLTGLSDLSLDAPGIGTAEAGQLATLRNLRSLTLTNPDGDGEGEISPEVLRELRAALPHTEINGQWALPALRHLLADDASGDQDGQGDQEAGQTVEGALAARRRGGEAVTAYVTVRVPEGAHAFAPGSPEGLPVSVSLPESSPWRLVGEPVFPHTADAKLSGTALIVLELAGPADRSELDLDLEARVQTCADGSCHPPVTLRLGCVPTG